MSVYGGMGPGGPMGPMFPGQRSGPYPPGGPYNMVSILIVHEINLKLNHLLAIFIGMKTCCFAYSSPL